MKNRVLTSLLAFSLLLTALPVSLAVQAKESTEAVTMAEETTETTTTAEENTEANALSMILNDPELVDAISNLDEEQIKEYFKLAYALVTSEEVASLLQYPEMQALIEETIKQTLIFANTERELTEEILRTAGVEEVYISLFILLLDSGDTAFEALKVFQESEEGQQILAFVNECIGKEEFQKALEEAFISINESL